MNLKKDVTIHDPTVENFEIFCQPVQVSQVLLNLLKHAIDAFEKGGEVWAEFEVSATQGRGIVRDNGPGISSEVQERMFDPFFTTKAPGLGTDLGLGLGLALSQEIMARHGGNLHVSSGLGEGTQVTATFPLA